MHGSSFFGDCSKALIDLDAVMKEIWGAKLPAAIEQNILS